MPFFLTTRHFIITAALGLLLALAGCRPSPKPAPVVQTVSPIQFQDIADTSGLNYRWVITGKPPLTILQTIGNGAAFLDYDNSGNLSLLLVGVNHVALFHGDGHGHFTDVSRQMGLDKVRGYLLGCAVGDYDGDGYDDIYLSGYRAGLLLHNDKGRGFTDVTQQAGLKPQSWGTSCAFTETRPGSGKLDLFVCNYADFGPDPKKYQQLCESHGKMTSCGPRYYQPLRDAFFLNDGHGRFTDAGQSSGIKAGSTGRGLGVACAPLDSSMRPYIAVADDELAGDLFQPAGSERYHNIGSPSGVAFDRDGGIHGGMGTDWGDYDNDGRLDLAVATFQGEAKSLYHGDGDGLFSDRSYQTGLAGPTMPNVAFGMKWADFDNDGWLDLIIANGHVQDNIHEIDSSTTYRQTTQVFHNEGGRVFTDLSRSAGPAFQFPIVGRGLAVGDFDNDGRVDALVVNSDGKPLLLHNDSPNAGHWLSLRLIGTKSNRDGYGALVTVDASPGMAKMRLCHADGSYMSSSDKRVHVGLGTATLAQTVTIQWPSGHTDRIHNVAADHFYTLREGTAKLTEGDAGPGR